MVEVEALGEVIGQAHVVVGHEATRLRKGVDGGRRDGTRTTNEW